MNEVLGIDLSGPSTNFKEVPREWFREVRIDHPELKVVCVGLWTGGRRYDAASATLANARAEGWLTTAYYVVHDFLSPEEHFQEAVAAAGLEYHNLGFLSVDVEKPDEAWTVSMDTIDRSCDLVEMFGKPAPVYSSSYMWSRLGLGSMTKRRRIWNAYYDENSDIDYELYPWGGAVLVDLMGEQYAGSTPLTGGDLTIEVDFNVFDADYLQVGEQPMTKEEQAIIDAKFAQVGVVITEAFKQINDVRDRVNGAVVGLDQVKTGLSSLADLVHNSVGGGPTQTDQTKGAIAELQRITAKLIADRETDLKTVSDAGKLLATLTGKEG